MPADNDSTRSPATILPTQVEDEETAQSVELAISLMKQWKKPLGELHDGIQLLHRALNSATENHMIQNAVKSIALALSTRAFCSESAEDWKEALSFCRKIVENEVHITDHPSSEPDHIEVHIREGRDALDRFLRSPPLADLTTILAVLKGSLLSLISASRLDALAAYAQAMQYHYYHSGDRTDVSNAISILKYAHKCDTQNDSIGKQLCAALIARFDISGDTNDLLEVFSYYSAPKVDCAISLAVKSQEIGNIDDLCTAITLLQETRAELPLSADVYPIATSSLAAAFRLRYDNSGSPGDLDEVIFLEKDIVSSLLPFHPDRITYLQHLASSLGTRFDAQHITGDIEEIVLLHRQILDLQGDTEPGRLDTLELLANSLFSQYREFGIYNNIQEVISIYEEIIPSYHNPRITCMDNLASALLIEYQHDGSEISLNRAIDTGRKALQHKPQPHPTRPLSLNNLGNALFTRFQHHGHIDDINEAIALHRESVELKPPPHPDRPSALGNLASELVIRFRRTGRRADLDEATTLHEDALDLMPPQHRDRISRLNNVAGILIERVQFYQDEKLGASEIDKAVSMLREALALIRGFFNTDPSLSLDSLGCALLMRYQRLGQADDIMESISTLREGLKLCPSPHPGRAILLRHLATALTAYTRKEGIFHRLQEAISLGEEALELLPPTHPDRCAVYENMAEILIRLHTHTAPIDTDRWSSKGYLKRVMSSYSLALNCASASPLQRFIIANSWSSTADRYGYPDVLEAYDAAMHTLPLLVSLGLDVHSRHEALQRGSDGLARRAAVCAIRLGHLEKAVEYLEAGRAVFWSQALNMKHHLSSDRLGEIPPILAGKFKNLTSQLEKAAYRDIPDELTNNQRKISLEEEAASFSRLNQDWLAALEEIRNLDGFCNFLRPAEFATLKSAAVCPVIFLIPDGNTSNCLILTLTGVQHIPIPGLSEPGLRMLSTVVSTAAHQGSIPSSILDGVTKMGDMHITPALLKEETREWDETERLGGKRITGVEGTISSNVAFACVLTILWNEVVKPVIEQLRIKKCDKDQTRVQWCPTGLFTFLPIHAAGDYNPDRQENNHAHDYICSSYTPSIGALLASNSFASSHNHQKNHDLRMMIVVDTDRLPSTQSELDIIQTYVPDGALVKMGVPGSPAKMAKILESLPTMDVIHFACHGIQHKQKPLASSLIVQDGHLTISKMMQASPLHGNLAFLCACETATGDTQLPDEAMSIGASMMYIGFRNVVGTMWRMMDIDGPVIADAFYNELFKGAEGNRSTKPEYSMSSQALAIAVQKLRDNGADFRRWVPFIHLGM